MERVYWIKYKEHQVLYSDYSHLSAEELVVTAEKADVEQFPKHRHLSPGSLLSLVDVTDSLASKEAIATLKISAKLWQPLYKKQAVIGLSTMQRLFLNAVNKFSGGHSKPFDTREEALEWLIRAD